MTFQEKIFELTKLLIAATVEGSIRWSETADEDSFRTVLKTGLVRIERAPAFRFGVGGGAVPVTGAVDDFVFSLVVLDDRNKEIGRYVPDHFERAKALRDLWELAGQTARNAEQKLDSLLQEVGSRVKKT